MSAVVHDRYGPPDVPRLQDVERRRSSACGRAPRWRTSRPTWPSKGPAASATGRSRARVRFGGIPDHSRRPGRDHLSTWPRPCRSGRDEARLPGRIAEAAGGDAHEDRTVSVPPARRCAWGCAARRSGKRRGLVAGSRSGYARARRPMLLGADHHAVVGWGELTYVDCGDAPAPPGPPGSCDPPDLSALGLNNGAVAVNAFPGKW